MGRADALGLIALGVAGWAALQAAHAGQSDGLSVMGGGGPVGLPAYLPEWSHAPVSGGGAVYNVTVEAPKIGGLKKKSAGRSAVPTTTTGGFNPSLPSVSELAGRVKREGWESVKKEAKKSAFESAVGIPPLTDLSLWKDAAVSAAAHGAKKEERVQPAPKGSVELVKKVVGLTIPPLGMAWDVLGGVRSWFSR